MKAYKYKAGEGYFDELDAKTQEIVKDAILEAAENRRGPDGFKSNEESIDELPCRPSSGFMPFSHNKGGHVPAHKEAAKHIELRIDRTFQDIQEITFEEFKELLESKGINQGDCNYHSIYEASEKDKDLEPVLRFIEERENDDLSDDNSTVMHEIRFMYHGQDDSDGYHSASVSAAINLEAPYHRSHIS